MLEELFAYDRGRKSSIDTIATSGKAYLIVLISGSNKEKRSRGVTLKDIQHDMIKRIENCTGLKSIGQQTELIITMAMRLIKELQAINMFRETFHTDNISMMRASGLEPILISLNRKVITSTLFDHP